MTAETSMFGLYFVVILRTPPAANVPPTTATETDTTAGR